MTATNQAMVHRQMVRPKARIAGVNDDDRAPAVRQSSASAASISSQHQEPVSAASISSRYQQPASAAGISSQHQQPASAAGISSQHQQPASAASISSQSSAMAVNTFMQVRSPTPMATTEMPGPSESQVSSLKFTTLPKLTATVNAQPVRKCLGLPNPFIKFAA
ncbi:MAG: hypothetical protein M1839_002101 [Geoglossum umbratile]|nr:MAG: hypothetical protein M1839_002101 [Geoglossum umbratile]